MGSVKPQPGKYRPDNNEKVFTEVTARTISLSPQFIQICESKNIKPSIRQARDFRRGFGHFSK